MYLIADQGYWDSQFGNMEYYQLVPFLSSMPQLADVERRLLEQLDFVVPVLGEPLCGPQRIEASYQNDLDLSQERLMIGMMQRLLRRQKTSHTQLAPEHVPALVLEIAVNLRCNQPYH